MTTNLNPAHFNASGSKYLRHISRLLVDGCADVYAVLEAFNVTAPGSSENRQWPRRPSATPRGPGR